MSSDSTDWKDELGDELGVDRDGIELVDRVVERKLDEGELSSDDLLPRLSRRDLLAGGAALAGGSALLTGGAGTVTADPQYSNATGRVGTDSTPVESVTAQDITTEQLGADAAQVNGPLTGDSGSNYFPAPLEIPAETDRGNAIHLQNNDDNDTSGSGRYARLAWLTAGTNNSDNPKEWTVMTHDPPNSQGLSIYTSPEPTGTNTEDPNKRLDIGAGGDNVDTFWRNTNRILQTATSGPVQRDIQAGPQDDAYLRLILNSADGGELYQIRHRYFGGNPRLQIAGSNGTALYIDNGGERIGFEGNRLFGLREVGSQPSAGDLLTTEWAFTTDRDGTGTSSWLYKDSSGTAHYLDTDGTL